METSTAVVLVVVVLIVGAGIYVATQGPALQLGPVTPEGPTDPTAQIIAASGGALGATLSGVGSLIGGLSRGSENSAAGAAK